MAPGGQANRRYRLVVAQGDRKRVYEDREFQTRAAAEQAARRAMRDARTVGEGASVVLQCGVTSEYPTFDAARIVPGSRGGWSAANWRDEQRWSLDRADSRTQRDEPRPREPSRAMATLLASVAVCLFATITIFAMQRSDERDSFDRSHAAPVLHELPITAATVGQPAKSRSPQASNLTDSLKAAMRSGDASDPVAAQVRGRRESHGPASARMPRGRQ